MLCVSCAAERVSASRSALRCRRALPVDRRPSRCAQRCPTVFGLSPLLLCCVVPAPPLLLVLSLSPLPACPVRWPRRGRGVHASHRHAQRHAYTMRIDHAQRAHTTKQRSEQRTPNAPITAPLASAAQRRAHERPRAAQHSRHTRNSIQHSGPHRHEEEHREERKRGKSTQSTVEPSR